MFSALWREKGNIIWLWIHSKAVDAIILFSFFFRTRVIFWSLLELQLFLYWPFIITSCLIKHLVATILSCLELISHPEYNHPFSFIVYVKYKEANHFQDMNLFTYKCFYLPKMLYIFIDNFGNQTEKYMLLNCICYF